MFVVYDLGCQNLHVNSAYEEAAQFAIPATLFSIAIFAASRYSTNLDAQSAKIALYGYGAAGLMMAATLPSIQLIAKHALCAAMNQL